MKQARWLLLGVWLVACEGSGALSFRVLTTAGDQPYVGADRVTLGVERAGQLDPGSRVDFDVDAARWPLEGIAYGRDLRLRVEARAGHLVLARGRSLPFDFEGPADVMDMPQPDVWLGTLGRFGAVHEGGYDAVAVARSPHGAWMVDAQGGLHRADSHAPEDARFRVRPEGDGGGLAWVGAGPDGLQGVGPDRWVHLDAEGRRTEQALATGYEPGAWVVGWAAGCLVVAGDGRLTALHGVPGSGRAEPVGRIDAPFASLSGVAVLQEGQPRVVLLADHTVYLVDPSGTRDPWPLDGRVARGARLARVAPGLVAVVGGEDERGPVADVELLVLGSALPQRLRPPPLFEGRVSPALVRLRDGLLLIAGGRGPAGALATAELLEVGLAGLPGEVSVTGRLPWPMAAPQGVRLADGTAWLVGEEGGALYFDPRDPAP